MKVSNEENVAEEGGNYFYHQPMFAYHSLRSAGLNRCNGGGHSNGEGKPSDRVCEMADAADLEALEAFWFPQIKKRRRKGDEQTEDTRQTLLDWN